jgi:hypothetical protein
MEGMPARYRTLGRRQDILRLADRRWRDVLEVPDWRWSLNLNRAWIEEGIRHYEPFLVVSRGQPRGTVLEWELQLVRAAGYVREGRWWKPR